jgi:glycosyltransferase involved in cell wall biosynthesis
MKIAYLLPNLESGGTERQVLALARLLDRARFSPSLVTTAGGGVLYREFAEIMPVTVFGDPERANQARTSLWGHAMTIRRLAGIFRRERPDIVHASLPASNVLGPIAARLAGVRRVIVSKRSLSDYKSGFPLLRRVEPLGNRLADVILVNADAVRRDVERTERFWEGKFRKIYNGVAVPRRRTAEEREGFRIREGIAPGERVVLSVANFFPYKGHLDLIEAARRVLAAVPEAFFLLAGRDAGAMEQCRERVRECGIGRRVRFLGPRFDVADLLHASDVFVHPSHQEGFPNAVLEAMAAAKAVVATGVGGVPEAVADGETGILVPAHDPAALADALVSLLGDTERARRMGEAGLRQVLERHAIERMVRETEGLYESLRSGEPLP